MPLFRKPTLAEDLADLLESERHILLNGDLAGLTAVETKKGKLRERLISLNDLSENELESLRQKSAHNERLLQAAQAGLDAANARLQMIMKNRVDFATYTRDGSRADDRGSGGTISEKF